jgi:photolyase PhrII
MGWSKSLMAGSVSIPRHLDERIRFHLQRDVKNSKSVTELSSGSTRFVLYWARSALRVDENPALDVAKSIAHQLRLPLLVYQGLCERYPFASDRHHTFIMQAAQQFGHDLQSHNIAYAFHLETQSTRAKYLVDLANLAACVVTEEMPVDPPRYFLRQLQRQTSTPIVTVDTACVLPMRQTKQCYTRAFQFREATQSQYDLRVHQPWPECEEAASSLDLADLPFQPVDLTSNRISDLVAGCDIDHAVGPVVDTIGGAQNGYRRWQTFLEKGLGSYHNRRNSADVDGVSRMSAYLHYGMVSPFRIAREAALKGGPGAEKFLDELLIWRELAYNFCFHRPDHDSWQAVPSWAQQTLLKHQQDPRSETYEWETLSRGKTGDALWNAAQHSLLRFGELHNNLRMTWGKMILNWVPDPRKALQVIFDLNHRYALDGRDPSSFAGILWCFGQFDRPFDPEQKIFGTVRTRSTTEHAKRLSGQSFAAAKLAKRYSNAPRIAVIGAGISGLIAARTLQDYGLDVQLFEKSRGVSGRVSTRRTESFQYDHGAQYFTCRHPIFQLHVDSWIEQGWVKTWGEGNEVVSYDKIHANRDSQGSLSASVEVGCSAQESEHSRMFADRIVIIRPNLPLSLAAPQKRYVACPGMSEFGKHLAKELRIQHETQITAVRPVGCRLELLSDADPVQGEFDKVVCTTPPLQSVEVLKYYPDLVSQLSAVKLLPCWAMLVSFEKTLPIEWAGAFVHDSPIAWISRESTKPGRKQTAGYVVHANPIWSAEHLELKPEQIAELLLAEFFRTTLCELETHIHCAAHRWRFSIAQQSLNVGCLFDQSRSVFACGDWAMGSRIEGAFLSGISAAGRILAQLEPSVADEKFAQPLLF